MELLSVAAAAAVLEVSPERVRQLIRFGRLDARPLAGRWSVDPISLDRLVHEQRPAGRPWAPSRAWGLLALAAGREAAWLTPPEIRRLRGVLANKGLEELAFQLRQRADRQGWYVHPGMQEDLLAEDGVVVGGAKASGKLRDGGPVDIYIAAAVLDRIVGRYLPDEHADKPNVIARVVRAPWPFAPGERMAWSQVAAADLLDGGDDRARRVGHELLGLGKSP